MPYVHAALKRGAINALRAPHGSRLRDFGVEAAIAYSVVCRARLRALGARCVR